MAKNIKETKNGNEVSKITENHQKTPVVRKKIGLPKKTETVDFSNGNKTLVIEQIPTEEKIEVIKPDSSANNSAIPEKVEEPAVIEPITATEIEAVLTKTELKNVRSIRPLISLLNSKGIRIKNAERNLKYEDELEKLQVELVKLQRWVQEHKRRVAILFEGRDAAGKGGTIRRFIEHLNPRAMRVVALPKPTEEEIGQWYFQRYVRQLPNRGEIVFFDRSWYNRAVVEPVMGFCDDEQYEQFMRQVTEFEHMLYEDGITLIKFWFSISKDEQQARFAAREINPLKQWKLSPIDLEAQGMWDKYTMYKEKMFSRTHTTFSPWVIVRANDKKKARLESIRYVLASIDYEHKGESGASLYPDPNIITRFHRLARNLD